MKKRIIIIDIDGTAIDTPRQTLPSKRLIKATAELKKKYYICAATGRSIDWAKEATDPMGLEGPIITSGGTSIFNPLNKRLIWRQLIEQKSINKILKIMEESGGNVLFNDYSKEDYYNGGWPSSELAKVKQAYFLELVFLPKEIAKRIIKLFDSIELVHATMLHSQRPNLYDIHIVHEKATKEHAINELYKILKVGADRSIGVGDGLNDIHLFNAVNLKVAMGNAVGELKAASDMVIGSVKDDGLAEYFEELAKQ